jgi:hypothetical protein
MTSSVDTAELPRVRPIADGPLAAPAAPAPPAAPVAPAAPLAPSAAPEPVLLAVEATAEPVAVVGRCQLQAERKAARRLRHRYEAIGLCVLAASLAATVAVLDVIR